MSNLCNMEGNIDIVSSCKEETIKVVKEWMNEKGYNKYFILSSFGNCIGGQEDYNWKNTNGHESEETMLQEIIDKILSIEPEVLFEGEITIQSSKCLSDYYMLLDDKYPGIVQTAQDIITKTKYEPIRKEVTKC